METCPEPPDYSTRPGFLQIPGQVGGETQRGAATSKGHTASAASVTDSTDRSRGGGLGVGRPARVCAGSYVPGSTAPLGFPHLPQPLHQHALVASRIQVPLFQLRPQVDHPQVAEPPRPTLRGARTKGGVARPGPGFRHPRFRDFPTRSGTPSTRWHQLWRLGGRTKWRCRRGKRTRFLPPPFAAAQAHSSDAPPRSHAKAVSSLAGTSAHAQPVVSPPSPPPPRPRRHPLFNAHAHRLATLTDPRLPLAALPGCARHRSTASAPTVMRRRTTCSTHASWSAAKREPARRAYVVSAAAHTALG